MPALAHAQAVDEVKFSSLPDGYKITINFLFALQYQSHAPKEPAKEFYVQLKTTDFRTLSSQDLDTLRDRQTWGPDPASSIPLREIIFEGGDPERPQMTFLFNEPVECEFRGSGNLRSLIVKVKTKNPPVVLPQGKPEVAQKKTEQRPKEISLPKIIISGNRSMAKLMEDARDALVKGQYDRAVAFYTKILQTAQGPIKQQAQELLGVARERNGQLAHAKAEYEKYLQEFPNGPDAVRVRQRLAGLITAATTPKEKLKTAKPTQEKGAGKWSVQNYGSFSQFYFRDQTIPVGGQTQVNRSDFSSDLDINSRWKSDDWDINARFTGGYLQDFLKGMDNQASLSALSLEMRSKKNGWYGKFGRQTLNKGGVFGRFDGANLSVKLNSFVKMNGVFGFPVDSSTQTSINTDKRFYGVNFDFGTFWQRWDFNAYFFNQDNHGLTDRRSIGGEARYIDPQKSLFTLFDYDIFFNTLNMFLFNGHWTFPTKTTLNLILDYRKSPLLTLTNAIIGQGVDKLSDLLGRFSRREIKQLALDRTTNSKLATLGITQDLKQNLQLYGEFTIDELEGTISSAGVDGSASTGKEYTYSLQLINSSFFKENDVIIYGLSYTNGAQNNTYTAYINGSFPMTKKLRLMPKIRFDYRNATSGGDNRFTFQPSVRLDYNVTKSAQLELEGGIEWINEKSSGINQKSTESFVSAGYRINF